MGFDIDGLIVLVCYDAIYRCVGVLVCVGFGLVV